MTWLAVALGGALRTIARHWNSLGFALVWAGYYATVSLR
jgi:hypothetical protein